MEHGPHGEPVKASASRRWFAVALGVIALAYLLFVAMMLALTGPFAYVGVDYWNTLCTLRFIHHNGFAQAYDPSAQAAFYRVVDAGRAESATCQTPPNPYLPVFQALLVPLALLPPIAGYVLWTGLGLVVFVLYCYRFGRAVGADHGPAALLKLALAYALYENLVAGQVNVLLFVCFGEAILACLRGRQLRGGAWLAGMLVKPQVLLLVLPGLAIGRRGRVLLGFGLTSALLAGISLAIAGSDGLLGLFRLLRYYSGGVAPTYPEAGMNWRGLAINLMPLIGGVAAWSVALPGLVATALAGLAVWAAPRRGDANDQLVVALLGSFAASSATTWHSHVYSGLPALAPLLYLRARGLLPNWLLNAWLVLPGAGFFLAAFGMAPKAGHPAAGLAMLSVNVLLVLWATRAAWRPEVAETAREAALGAGTRPRPTAA